MRKIYFSVILLISLLIVAFSAQAEVKSRSAESADSVFWIYRDGKSTQNHFYPAGWMGDYGDLKLNHNWTQNPFSEKSCIQIKYNAKNSQKAGWAGMYWQSEVRGWGPPRNSFNLTGYKRLKFWIRGENGSELFTEFKVGSITGEYPDTACVSIGPVKLSKEWKEYEINLEGKDLTRIMGGFCWAATAKDNPNGFTFYLDDIRFEE